MGGNFRRVTKMNSDGTTVEIKFKRLDSAGGNFLFYRPLKH